MNQTRLEQHMSEFNRPTSTVISNAQNLLMEQATQNPTASLIKEMVELAAST
jgi:chemotaxis regulatin CheY-phosphate phosphatase CheZ